MAPRSLRSGLRIGVLRAGPRTSEYKPIATLSFVRDGGIHVTPAALPDARWRYGALQDQRPESAEQTAVTDARPKLHYHDSGFVSVSLTGSNIERRSVQYPPLRSLARNQILSVFASRPWELPSKSFDRGGDVSVSDDRWPLVVGFSLALLDSNPRSPNRLHSIGDRGLISGDHHRFFVDLTEFGREGLLIGHCHLYYEDIPPQDASVTVAAYPQSNSNERPKEVFALYNDTAHNPLAIWEPAEELLGSSDFDIALTGRVDTFDTSQLRARAEATRRRLEWMTALGNG